MTPMSAFLTQEWSNLRDGQTLANHTILHVLHNKSHNPKPNQGLMCQDRLRKFRDLLRCCLHNNRHMCKTITLHKGGIRANKETLLCQWHK